MNETNTLENKAKFFSQYWGQEVLQTFYADGKSVGDLWPNDLSIKPNSKDYLELTPLSDITDEDALYISSLRISEWANSKESVKINIDKMSHSMMPSIVIDYLRSKGYAVDWLTIAVKKQLEWGWIKLKSN